jgi:hypothetical protein
MGQYCRILRSGRVSGSGLKTEDQGTLSTVTSDPIMTLSLSQWVIRKRSGT